MTTTFAKPILALALWAFAALASAGPQEAYSPSRFDQLAKEGKPVVVAVHADWCPTCKAQKPIMKELMGRPEYKDVVELTVDFDKDKEALKRFKVAQQSAMVAFKGDKEIGRSVGDTSKAGLEELVKKAAR